MMFGFGLGFAGRSRPVRSREVGKRAEPRARVAAAREQIPCRDALITHRAWKHIKERHKPS